MTIAVFILVILLAILVFWYVSAKVHELALKAARDICQQENWQLLDDTVSLRKIGLGRGSDGRIHFRRHYQFSYTQYQGERYEKTIVMLGNEPIYKTETKDNVISFPQRRGKL